jgi:hypothetical protein
MSSQKIAPQSATRTTSLVQVASCEMISQEKEEEEFHRLHLDWVLIADAKGDSRPQMHWLIN